MSVIRRSPPADHTGLNALSAEQLRAKVLTAEAMYRTQGRELERLTEQLQRAVNLSADELQCLTCAMAGNFPEQFESIRADLLRKLFKAHPYTSGGQS